MRNLMSVLFCLSVCGLPFGCSKQSGANGKPAKGSGDAKADLRKIWDKVNDFYRKTGRPTPPDLIPEGLATIYNYEVFLPERVSTGGPKHIVAYESKPTNGKRYVLYPDGAIERLTDTELSEMGYDPDPLTANERSEKERKKSEKQMDDLMKKAHERLAQDEKERDEKAKREREQTDREVEKARAEMERKRKDFEEKQRTEREQQDKEIEKQRQDMEKKRKDFEEKQKNLERNNPKGTTSFPTKSSAEKEPASKIKLDIRTSLRTKVSLKSPYPQSYSGAPTDKISVQYAAMEILKQAGVNYDFKKSQANVGEVARRWITPNIVEAPCDTALAQILGSAGLTYEIDNGNVVLKRK
jgi:hypothetical protein